MRDEIFNPHIQSDAPITFINCGYENCKENFCCNAHIRDYFLLHYVVDGTGFYEVEGNRFQVSRGEVFVIYPGEIVKYYAPFPDKKWTFAWIGFNGRNADVYLREALGESKRYLCEGCDDSFVDVVEGCLNYFHDNFNMLSNFVLNSYVFKCLSRIEQSLKKHNDSIQSNIYSDMAEQYIRYNYMNNITVNEIADYLNIDRSYLYRLFKRNFKISPQEYLINYRIKKAKELLLKGHRINRVAELTGFESVYGFSAMFKKKTGISPTQYCKSKKSET